MYEPQPGEFPYCQGNWNERTKSYENDYMSVINCCIKKCFPQTENCLENCEKETDYKKCKNICNQNKDSCKDYCTLKVPGHTRTFIECTEDTNECGYYPNLDSKCIQNKKDELLQCCRSRCIPSEKENCEENCLGAYRYFTNKTLLPYLEELGRTKEKYQRNKKSARKQRNKGWLLLFGIILCIIWFIFGFYFVSTH